MSDIKRFYGWKPDSEEARAAAPKLAIHPRELMALPNEIDLREYFPDAYNQLSLGSCTANGTAAGIQYDQKVQGLDPVMPSRLFDYYNSRLIEGTVNQDAGASISDAVKAIAMYGWCPENLVGLDSTQACYPYVIERFSQKPPQECYATAVANKITDYARVQQDLNHLQATLAAKHPIIFGFTVFPSFESQQVAKSGIMPMPTWADQQRGSVGGHCVVAVGYSNTQHAFLCRNSWGKWGLNGYFWMPYSYILHPRLASDFRVINSIPGTKLNIDMSIVGS